MNTTLSNSAKVRLFLLVVLLIASGATIWAGFRNRPAPESPPTTPDDVLAELKAGNKRFQDSHRTRTVDTRSDAERRKELAKKPQRPIAAVLCCADSRLVSEFIFDQEFGRIFQASNSGNVVDSDVLGSLEYAVEHLHVQLIVVLGHSGCRAVNAVADAGNEPLPNHLRDIQEHMKAVHDAAIKAGTNKPDGFLERMYATNAEAQARRLVEESSVLREAVNKQEVRIVVGVYDLESGKVEGPDFDDRK